MKKLILLIILTGVLAVVSCGTKTETEPTLMPSEPTSATSPKRTITPDQIDTFSYSEGEFGVYDEYSVDGRSLTARLIMHDFYKPEIEIIQSWTQEKWNAFTEDLLACGIADWKKSYYDEAYYTGELIYDGGWDLTVTGEYVFIDIEGGESPDDGQFSDMLREYFYWSAPEFDAKAEPVELMAEVPLPAPEKGEWYDWDKAGTFTLNPKFFLYYDEFQDLLVRVDNDSILHVSKPEGSEEKLINREGYNYQFDYFDGWIYYEKWDQGIWKSKIDGTGEQFVADIDYDIWVYDNSLYFYIENTEEFCCYSLDNDTLEMIHMPGHHIGPYFFENDLFYYGAFNDDNNVGNRMSIYRYDLETRQAVELTNRSIGDYAVRDGMLYYLDDGLTRTDGNITEKVKSSVGYYFTLYRNYLLYITYNRDWTCMLYALNLDTGMEYELFELPVPFGSSRSDIYVMDNTVFIYNASYDNGPIFRITFDNDIARLWKLNGLSK